VVVLSVLGQHRQTTGDAKSVHVEFVQMLHFLNGRYARLTGVGTVVVYCTMAYVFACALSRVASISANLEVMSAIHTNVVYARLQVYFMDDALSVNVNIATKSSCQVATSVQITGVTHASLSNIARAIATAYIVRTLELDFAESVRITFARPVFQNILVSARNASVPSVQKLGNVVPIQFNHMCHANDRVVPSVADMNMSSIPIIAHIASASNVAMLECTPSN
jgi:hypothetical protein